MGVPTNCQFAVDFPSQSTKECVKKSLLTQQDGINSVTFDDRNSQVVIESTLPSGHLHKLIEACGVKAVLLGQGPGVSDPIYTSAAVSIVTGNLVKGVVRFMQLDKDTCIVDGAIDGLSPGYHGIHVHEYGDLSNGCHSTGGHFNPTECSHGDRLDEERHAGDLGNIHADEDGRSLFRFSDQKLKVWDVIGRSLVIDEEKDRGYHQQRHSIIGIACGIIARSAGIFQNEKKICSCTGKTLWQERDEAIENSSSSQPKAQL